MAPLTGVFRIEAGGPIGGRGRLVAALLAVALLFCHGALGALHQVSSWPAEHAGGQPHAPATAPATAEHHGGPVAHADYAAVFFVVLLGAALALLLGGLSLRGTVVSPRIFGRVFLPLFLRPPRGPTPPLLQVFRL